MQNEVDEIIKIGDRTLVIAGMATMPSRFDTFTTAINSILPQVDHLFLFLDRFEELYISGDPRVTVLRSDRFGDLRANGKFMGLNMAGADAYYLCVDDDIEYPPDYVQRMLGFLESNGNSVAASVHGSILKPDFNRYLNDRFILHRSGALVEPSRVHIAGTCTTVFHTSKLQFDVRDWHTTNMVDLNFAQECKNRGLPIVSMPREEGWIKCIEEHQADSIYNSLKADDTIQTQLAKRLISTET